MAKSTGDGVGFRGMSMVYMDTKELNQKGGGFKLGVRVRDMDMSVLSLGGRRREDTPAQADTGWLKGLIAHPTIM